MATETQANSVLELYSAYFNRAADAGGFTFWKDSFDQYFAVADSTADDNAKTLFALQKIATDMSGAPEYVALYPATQSNTEFVEAIYINLLNRPSEPEGLAFWVGHIDGGTMTKEVAITQMIAGAKGNESDQGKLDAALINNKNTVSKYFAELAKTLTTEEEVALAKTAFTGLTDDAATIATANAALDAAVANASATALTTETDSFVGTAENDTVSSANGTLQSADSIIDISTTDADVVNLTSLIFDSAIKPLIKNFETINVTATTNSVGLDLTTVSGAKVLNLDTTATSGTATVLNASITAASSIVAGDNITKLQVAVDAEGTGGSLSINANKATTVMLQGGAKDDTIIADIAADVASILLDSGTTAGTDKFTLNLKGTAATGATFTTTANLLDELTLNLSTGAAIFNLPTATPPTVVDTAGKLIVLGDQDITFVGDTPSFTGVEVVSAIGDKTATFQITGTAAGTSAGGDISKAAFNVVDVTKAITLTSTIVHADTKIKLSIANDKAVAFASTGATDALDIDLGGNQKSITLIIAEKVNLTNTTADVVIESYSNAVADGTTTITGDKVLTIKDWNNGTATSKIDATALTKGLTIEGINTTGIVTGVKEGTVMGGTDTDKLSITGISGTAILKGQAGDDALTIAMFDTDGSGAATTYTAAKGKIDGGEGNDTLILNSNEGTAIGGAGSDKFVFNVDTTNRPIPSDTALNTIEDFVNNEDKIDYSKKMTIIEYATTAAAGTAKISAQGLATFEATDTSLALKLIAVENGINLGGAAAQGQAAVFVDGSDSYLFISDGTDAVDTGDVLVKLTGLTAKGLTLDATNGDLISFV